MATRRASTSLHCRVREDLKQALERECERRQRAGTPTTIRHLVEEALELWHEHTTLQTEGIRVGCACSVAEQPRLGQQTAPPCGYEESILL